MRGQGGGLAPGHLKQQLWRENRPFHAKSSLFIITIIRNVHMAAKPVGHTFTKGPAILGQEGSGPFQPVCSDSWDGDASCSVKEQNDFIV